MKRLQKMRKQFRLKKLRGWKAKQFFTVRISKITKEGFWLHNEGQNFYISRKQYPWFLDATDEEIRDVWKIHDAIDNGRRNHLQWNMLEIDILMEHLKHPELLTVHNVYVRKEQREDLYELHAQWLQEKQGSSFFNS